MTAMDPFDLYMVYEPILDREATKKKLLSNVIKFKPDFSLEVIIMTICL